MSRPTGRDAVTEAILEAAARLMRDRAPGDVTVREIAAEADVNHGLVHSYFGNKRGVVTAVLQRRAQELAARVEPGDDLHDALVHMFGDGESDTYTRLLASLVMDTPAGEVVFEHGWVADAMRHAASEGGADEDTVELAAVLAAVLGWQLFRPVIVPLFGLEAKDEEELFAAVASPRILRS